MVKFNEALIIGGSLLAALVLSKGSSILPSMRLSENAGDNFLSYYKEIDKQQIKAVEKQESNISTLENIKQTNQQLREYNLDIAQQILDYERNLTQLQISQIENEMGKTQSFISQEQKFKPSSLLGLGDNWTGKSAVNKWKSTYDYYSKVWSGEKGPLNQVSLFPDIYIPLNQKTLSTFQAQARYEEAQQRISESNQLIFRQQAEIDRLEEEYQTRFGGLSRYG